MSTTPAAARPLPLVLALALVLAACGGGEAGEPDDVTVPEEESAVILEVRDVGGFAPVEALIGRVPRFVLTAGRTLHFQGPQIMIYPGPLLPNVQSVVLDEETFEQVLAYVSDIGFPEFDRLENRDAQNTVADAPNTVVTWFDEGGAHVFDVYALGFMEQQTDARVAMLADLVALLDEAALSGTPSQPYVADRVEVNAAPREAPVEPEFRNVRPWPLPQPFAELDEGLLGWRCAVYEGDEAAALLTEFEQANQATTWDLDGTEYALIPAPLFPHEEGCTADVA